ncbi:hypothetical protein HPG69_007278 [Diceros bicornis minor]|uniref:KRAB domain-containing protein n=1 Tax=Diceros bicornis minor TaxID=77932 RepID=A0A7J7FN73_DICBM|nr:hypothetical protein HPG69_007278 [Diceros bicornis minor]
MLSPLHRGGCEPQQSRLRTRRPCSRPRFYHRSVAEAAPMNSPEGPTSVAEMLMDPAQGCVVFEVVAVSFSQEWDLLDEAQRCLCHHVMLEIVVLLFPIGLSNIRPTLKVLRVISRPTSCHQSQHALHQYVFIGVEPRMKRQLLSKLFLWDCHRSGLQSQKAQPCDTCGLLLKDILHLPQHNITHLHQGLSPYGTILHQDPKNQSRGKIYIKDSENLSFVMDHGVHVTEGTLTCTEGEEGFPASPVFLQPQAPQSDGKPHRDRECKEAFEKYVIKGPANELKYEDIVPNRGKPGGYQDYEWMFKLKKFV